MPKEIFQSYETWNHTGVEFWAFRDIVKNKEKSAFTDWYSIRSFDNPSTPQNEFNYKGWLNIQSLPEIKKINITTERRDGLPYEGNINEGAKKHIFDVTQRWLAPDGNVNKGIDGFRLDVADQIPMLLICTATRHSLPKPTYQASFFQNKSHVNNYLLMYQAN